MQTSWLSIVTVLVLVTPVTAQQPKSTNNPPASLKVTSPEVKVLTTAEIEALHANDDLILPSADRTTAISKLALSYTIRYSSPGKMRTSYTNKVYVSPDILYVENENSVGPSYVFSCTRGIGGFLIAKLAGSKDYTLDHLLMADQLDADLSARINFEKLCSVRLDLVRTHGGNGSKIPTTNIFIGNYGLKIISRKKITTELLSVEYSHDPTRYAPTAFKTTGNAVIDTGMGNVLVQVDERLTSGADVRSVLTKMTYHPPSSEIPYPMLKRLDVTEKQSKSQTEADHWIVDYSDYKIESPPPEKLRLSYYHLSDDLIASQKPTRWPYYTVAGVLALVGIGVWLARRKRTTGA